MSDVGKVILLHDALGNVLDGYAHVFEPFIRVGINAVLVVPIWGIIKYYLGATTIVTIRFWTTSDMLFDCI